MTAVARHRLLGSRAARIAAAWLALGAFVAADAGPAAGAEPLLDEDALVARVLALADERLALMPAVAAAKWPRHLPVADEVREAAVIRSAGERARASGLEPGPVEQLFGVQIRLARALQEGLYRRWGADGFGSAGATLDLGTELRPRLDRLASAMNDALYLAAPRLARPPSTELVARGLPAERWSDADRAALLGALGGIRYAVPPSIARARAAGILRVGTPADYAPFSVAIDGNLSGADVELARALGRALGLRTVFVRTSWRTLLEDLRADRFDIAIGGISVTAARAAEAEFSVPISRSGKTAIGRCADAKRFAALAAIDRPSVAVIENPGGTNESFAHGHLAAARLVVHPDNRTIFEELVAGRADVMFTDETEVALATRRHPELCRLLGESFDPADKAILLARGGAWAESIDPWLREQVRAGVPARLLAEALAR